MFNRAKSSELGSILPHIAMISTLMSIVENVEVGAGGLVFQLYYHHVRLLLGAKKAGPPERAVSHHDPERFQQLA